MSAATDAHRVWVEQNYRRAGSALQRAFIAGFESAAATPDAGAAWRGYEDTKHGRFGDAQYNAFLNGHAAATRPVMTPLETFTPNPALVAAWNALPTEVQLVELRQGEWSGFYPVFHDDPTAWAECDRDGRVVVMAEGVCPQCGAEVRDAKGLAA